MLYEHTYAPFNFGNGKRHMISACMANNYIESLRENPMLRATDFKIAVKKQHNYNATMSCILG